MSRTVVDLFAGAGGLSKGFLDAGYEVEYAVERDLWASQTYSKNHVDVPLDTLDVIEISDARLAQFSGADVVMGGPPCQGFSISASNRRDPNDPRNYLYRELIRAVKIIRPKLVLMENVKEVTRYLLPDGSLLVDDIQSKLNDLGYSTAVLQLNAVNFGVPQNRQRTFVLGVPNENEQIELVDSLRQKALSSTLTTNLWEAISDLPEVQPRQVDEETVQNYRIGPQNEYQKSAREQSMAVKNHVPMRHTARMIERFQIQLEEEADKKQELPEELGPRARGNPTIISKKKYHQNHRKLLPDRPSPTITASFYSSFIHPFQPRNLTVREAARLQSFPDVFHFLGKRTTLSKKLLAKKGVVEDLHLDQFNQVGNAVPPKLAKAIADAAMFRLLK